MPRAAPIAVEAHEGQCLRKLRKSSGLSQARLAKLAAVGCHTVSRWENKERFHRRSRSLKSIIAVLETLRRNSTSLTRARLGGVLRSRGVEQVQTATLKYALRRQKQAPSDARKRVLCGAKTRKGSPCRLISEPEKRRCKFHGGKSTGPKTFEGRQLG